MNALLQEKEFEIFNQATKVGNETLTDEQAKGLLKEMKCISRSPYGIFRRFQKGNPLMIGDILITEGNSSERVSKVWKAVEHKEIYVSKLDLKSLQEDVQRVTTVFFFQ
jgi:hypothetical protein